LGTTEFQWLVACGTIQCLALEMLADKLLETASDMTVPSVLTWLVNN